MSLRISMTLESYDEQHVWREPDIRCSLHRGLLCGTNQPDAGAAIAAAAFLQKCSDPHFAPQPISPERSFAAQHFDNPAIGQN